VKKFNPGKKKTKAIVLRNGKYQRKKTVTLVAFLPMTEPNITKHSM